jgi:hypothetical protein
VWVFGSVRCVCVCGVCERSDISGKLDGLVVALNAGAKVLSDIRNKPMPGYLLAKLKVSNAKGAGAGAGAAAADGKDKTKKEKMRDRRRAEQESKQQLAMREREAELGGATGSDTAVSATDAKTKPASASASASGAKPSAAAAAAVQVPAAATTATPSASAGATGPVVALSDGKNEDIAQFVEYFPVLLKQHEKLTSVLRCAALRCAAALLPAASPRLSCSYCINAMYVLCVVCCVLRGA